MNVPSRTKMKIELILNSCPRRVHVLQQKILKLKFFKIFLRETETRSVCDVWVREMMCVGMCRVCYYRDFF